VTVRTAAVSRLPDGGRFVALDSWRGLAALGVAAYHVEGGGPLFDNPAVDRFGLWVEFFFVLSGFVLSAAYGERLANGFPVGRYMLLRLGRIYPLHLAMVGAYVLLEVAFLLLRPEGWPGREAFGGAREPFALLASLTWRCVEAPAREWSRRRAARWGAGRAESAAPTI